MAKQDVGKIVSRREILKLAGTAAAFCTSFGFLSGGQKGRVAVTAKHFKWTQAELKWYGGNELLGSTPFPVKVLKHLESNEEATLELKVFRSGSLLRNLGTYQFKF